MQIPPSSRLILQPAVTCILLLCISLTLQRCQSFPWNWRAENHAWLWLAAQGKSSAMKQCVCIIKWPIFINVIQPIFGVKKKYQATKMTIFLVRKKQNFRGRKRCSMSSTNIRHENKNPRHQSSPPENISAPSNLPSPRSIKLLFGSESTTSVLPARRRRRGPPPLFYCQQNSAVLLKQREWMRLSRGERASSHAEADRARERLLDWSRSLCGSNAGARSKHCRCVAAALITGAKVLNHRAMREAEEARVRSDRLTRKAKKVNKNSNAKPHSAITNRRDSLR